MGGMRGKDGERQAEEEKGCLLLQKFQLGESGEYSRESQNIWVWKLGMSGSESVGKIDHSSSLPQSEPQTLCG